MGNGAIAQRSERVEDEGAAARPDELIRAGAPAPANGADLRLATGEHVLVTSTAAELLDAEGRLMLRYEGGVLTLAAPAGDVVFAAPSGRVVFEAGQDIAFSASRDVVQRAGRAVSLAAGDDGRSRVSVDRAGAEIASPRLDVRAAVTSADVGEATVSATSARTSAKTLSFVTERFELSATRIVERAQDAFRDIAELAQTRVGRARTLVRDVYALYTGRTTLTSKDDTRVDGKRIHLG